MTLGNRPARRRAGLVAALAALAVLGAGGRPAASPGADAGRIRSARAHYESAVSHYNLDEFAPALAEFREAYRVKPDPSFLFNIAQCHRKLGQLEPALDFYRKYLRSMPDAPNRADVERIVAELRARGASQAEPAAVVAPPVADPTAVTAVTPAVTVATPALTAAPVEPAPPLGVSAASGVVAVPAAPPRKPLYRRWWFWTSLGVAATAIVVAGVAWTPREPYTGNTEPGVITVPGN